MRAFLAPTLLLVLIGTVRAQDATLPEAADVRRIAESFGLTKVETGAVTVKDGKLVALGVTGVMPPGATRSTDLPFSIGAVTVEGIRVVGGAKVYGLVGVERVDASGFGIDQAIVSDLRLPSQGGKARYSAV